MAVACWHTRNWRKTCGSAHNVTHWISSRSCETAESSDLVHSTQYDDKKGFDTCERHIIPFPSPRPSPLGRGRIVPSWLNNPTPLESSRGAPLYPLRASERRSQRNRARPAPVPDVTKLNCHCTSSSSVVLATDHGPLTTGYSTRILLRAFSQRQDHFLVRQFRLQVRDLVSTGEQRQRDLPALSHGTVERRHDFKTFVRIGKAARMHLGVIVEPIGH